jgi:hypothetical protein
MTLPEHKVIIKDFSEKKYPFRNLEVNVKKPFTFKGYKTEDERINENIKLNQFLYSMTEPNIPKNNSLNNNKKEKEDEYNFDIPNPNQIQKLSVIKETEKIRDILKNNIVIQPEMRFKARTDLERIYDALKNKYYRANERQIIERQLKNLNLNSFQTTESIKKRMSVISPIKDDKENEEEDEQKYKIKPNPLYEEARKKELEINSTDVIYGDGNLYYIPKKQYLKPWQRNLDLNSEAEGILSEYHIKTHFKACAEVAEKKIDYKKLNKHKRSQTIDSTPKNLFEIKTKDFNDKDNEIKYDNYEKNENPYSHKFNGNNIDPESLRALSVLAFEKDSIIRGDEPVVGQYIPMGKKNKYYHKRKLVDENSVLIDGKILFKDSQFDIIANKVLNICNVNKKKSKFNNTSLKKKEGKLMITRGLSVGEFEKKYKI